MGRLKKPSSSSSSSSHGLIISCLFLFTLSFSFLKSSAEPDFDPPSIAKNRLKSCEHYKEPEPILPPYIGRQQSQYDFLFPETQSKVVPDPALFFTRSLISSPLPTNSFFQNFVVPDGTLPEYIHPYLIQSSLSSLSVSYPSIFSNSTYTTQIFEPDLNISVSEPPVSNSTHVVSSYSDLGVTLDIPASNLRFFLIRGSPFLTFDATENVSLSISACHSVLGFFCSSSLTKCTIKLDNNQTWLIYASSPIRFSRNGSAITSGPFSGTIRIAVLSGSDPNNEAVLDRFSSSYPVSGEALLNKPYHIQYKWKKEGEGDLLILAHPLHLKLLSENDSSVTVLNDFKYRSIDGELVGIVGDSWLLKTDPISVTWHSKRGISAKSQPEIIPELRKDVDALNPRNMSTNSSYFYGKLIARAARLALIAEEVCYPEVIPKVQKFLKDAIEPWLNGSFAGNGFLYERKWGGLVTKQGALDSTADFGFGIYNDHHFHLGYFIYAIAVLAKFDPDWGLKFKPQAYSLVEDYLNLDGKANSHYPRLRNFDAWKLHSWAAGLNEFPHGRNQESTSEAVNAYYAAALLGLAYGDANLVALGSTITAMEILSAQTWWHVRRKSDLYDEKFSDDNRVVGILWASQRYSGLWFAPPESREIRLGIQVLPILPITRVLFSDESYVKELVKWTLPAMSREGVVDGWRGFVYALQGLYDVKEALDSIRKLKAFDDGNSYTNLLWWIHSQ